MNGYHVVPKTSKMQPLLPQYLLQNDIIYRYLVYASAYIKGSNIPITIKNSDYF